MHERKFLLLPLCVVFVVLGLMPSIQTAVAQGEASGQGIMLVFDWPDDLTRESAGFDILPFIDSLSIAYRYQVQEGHPELSIVMEWTPTGDAIFKGERRSLRDLDGTPAIIGIELAADAVSSDGKYLAGFSLTVDSMIVEPSPDLIRIDLPDLNWGNVFVDTPASQAEEIFAEGFELVDPTIVRAGFAQLSGSRELAVEVIERRDRGGGDAPRVGSPGRSDNAIYRRPATIDIGFDLFWLIGSGGRPDRISDDRPRENIGRGSLGGTSRSRGDRSDGSDRSRDGSDDRSVDRESSRATAERDRGDGRSPVRLPRSGKNDSDDDDDDDDDDEIVPYAVAAVAAAGALALVGGTIGYYGNSRYAPLGLTSGFVGRDGGILLQVAVNEALLADDAGPKRLMGRILGFGDILRSSRFQAALGGGVLLTSRGSDMKYESSITMGAVARFDPLLLYAGYDVMQNSPEFSLAINLRRLGLWGKK